jgi:hypothetical protein
VVHRQKIEICRGVSYQMRAIAYDIDNRPVPTGKLVWKSNNPKLVNINSDNGTIQTMAVGLTTVTATTQVGNLNASAAVQVHEAIELQIKNQAPVTIGSNRRIQLV